MLLIELARLGTVSKLWAATYKARLSAEQQRLKVLVAETQLGSPSVAPHRSLAVLLPTHLPPSPTPLIQDVWVPFIPQDPQFADTWRPHRLRRIPSQTFINTNDCYLSKGRVFRISFSKRACHQRKRISVVAGVGKAEDMPLLLGLLLVLIQDRLPLLLEQSRGEQNSLPGRPAPSALVVVRCVLGFRSSLGMWAPVVPLLQKVHFRQLNPDGMEYIPRSQIFSFGHKGMVFSRPRKARQGRRDTREVRASAPHLDVVLEVCAPSWGE